MPMIQTMIKKWIQSKQQVKVYYLLGQAGHASTTGVITGYGAENDAITLVHSQPHVPPSMIPITSIHSIIASE